MFLAAIRKMFQSIMSHFFDSTCKISQSVMSHLFCLTATCMMFQSGMSSLFFSQQHVRRFSQTCHTFFLHLMYQVHRSGPLGVFDDHGVMPLGVLSRCNTRECDRCMKGQGGYKFRWCDKRWYSTYEGMARPGAWGLGDFAT